MLLEYYEKLLQLKCFSFDDAAKIFGDERKAKNILYTLKKKGLLQSIRRNYYATISLETKEAVATPFEIASSITENSYISHHSAFEFYGLANQVFSGIYVSTGREFREFEFDGRWYHCMKTQRDFGVSLQKTIRVTDLERTVLDNIKDFDKVGGLEELLRCLEMITVLDEGRLTTYLGRYHNQFLVQKVGYLLSFYPQLKLSEIANKQNFIRDTLEKVVRLSEVLDYINSNPIMKGCLALKGGTAINLTVFHLPRLSVDIDLDYCSEGNRDKMLGQRQKISEDMKKFMQTQGYSLNPQSRSRHSLDSFVFTYINLGGMRDNIKVEINYSLRSHLFELENRPVLSDVIHMEHLITVLSPVELFAAKINALLSRAVARDLYDTYNMIDMGLFSKDEYKMLRKSVVFYTAISQEEIPERYDMNVIDGSASEK